MGLGVANATPDALRRIRRVQAVTIALMSVEAAVSLFAAWRAHSPALLAFGGGSARVHRTRGRQVVRWPEWRWVEQALHQAKQVKADAALLLGVDRNRLNYLCRKYGI